jgi:hypothetical protein
METGELERIVERAVERAMKRHPRPTQVNLTQAGQMLNVSRTTVSRMVSAGKLRLNQCGLISIEQIDALLLPSPK